MVDLPIGAHVECFNKHDGFLMYKMDLVVEYISQQRDKIILYCPKWTETWI